MKGFVLNLLIKAMYLVGRDLFMSNQHPFSMTRRQGLLFVEQQKTPLLYEKALCSTYVGKLSTSSFTAEGECLDLNKENPKTARNVLMREE